jgi:hypothetical protein
MPHPKDQITTDEREAIADAVESEVTSRLGGTPKPTSISSTDMKAAIDSRCERCRRPDGSVGQLWAALDPMRIKMWLATGALVVISAVFSYTLPRINTKLDALDEMAKDMAALKVQVNFLITRPGASLPGDVVHYAQGVTP